MRTNTLQSMIKALTVSLLLLGSGQAFPLGSDYRNDQPVEGNSAWPDGMKALVDTTNRVHGFFVNANDLFFFSGTATNFSNFLRDYSKIQHIQQHRLILHAGVGEAKSPWGKEGKICDWKLDGCPAAWRTLRNGRSATPQNTNYILEVHFWLGGKIQLDQVAIPDNVEFAGDCLKNFQSITNGMTRAEVDKRLEMDGGLQGVSPVRYIDSACPGLKIKVEFDFKKDAANQGRAIMGSDDKVIRVSEPYVESAYRD